MSILKGILHHWNKTNKSYDTIHPETEVAQITDFNQGIINTLASTALGGLVNTLTSDSLMGTIMQKVLTASGVKYLAAQTGYLCFGKFFGGIIIQWGYYDVPASTFLAFPISYSEFVYKLTSKAFYRITKENGAGRSLSGILLDSSNLYYVTIGK